MKNGFTMPLDLQPKDGSATVEHFAFGEAVTAPARSHLSCAAAKTSGSLAQSLQDLKALLANSPNMPEDTGFEVVAQSKSMCEVLAQAQRIANTKVNVLLEGESGTGKELVARLIHCSGNRAGRPFVRVNCAALSESLVESELFGHEKGAFTGAAETRVGRFELADRGSLLLDEISEMSVQLQAKLLRVLESEEFERVGGTKTLKVDVRVIATTNRVLEQEIAQGNFRHDLYYRLNVVRFHLPALRERREDIPLLIDYFLQRAAREFGVPEKCVSHKTMDILTAYEWPGNIRQLHNVIQRSCLLADGDTIQPIDLPCLDVPSATVESFRDKKLDEIERQVILQTLRETGGNKTAAAQRLGVTPRTLLNKMNKYRTQGAA